MSLTEELQLAGLTVIEGRDVGRTTAVSGFVVIYTGQDFGHSDELNVVCTAADASFFIDRSNRVWKLANGPRGGDNHCVIVVGAVDEDSATDGQKETLSALQAVLHAFYDLPDDLPPLELLSGDPEPSDEAVEDDPEDA